MGNDYMYNNLIFIYAIYITHFFFNYTYEKYRSIYINFVQAKCCFVFIMIIIY